MEREADSSKAEPLSAEPSDASCEVSPPACFAAMSCAATPRSDESRAVASGGAAGAAALRMARRLGQYLGNALSGAPKPFTLRFAYSYTVKIYSDLRAGCPSLARRASYA